MEEKAEGAEQLAAELEEEQKQLELKKTEAKDKFYELCKTLVGVDKWDDEKQGIYDKLVQEKGEEVHTGWRCRSGQCSAVLAQCSVRVECCT